MSTRLNNNLIDLHLKYTETTEPPKLFHIWSALAAISSCAGRHTWLKTGLGNTYLNTFVLLVGPPGTRKSTAMKIPTKIARQCTSIKVAPDDTSGHRQGLLSAMTEAEEAEFSEKDLEEIASIAEGYVDTDSMDEYNGAPDLSKLDKFTLNVFASEWGSFIGQNNLDMLRFLIKMWDNESYTYKLKSEKISLKEACISMIGCTTPSEIVQLLPPEAIGGGFMSRIILVYSSKKYKEIPPSKVYRDETLVPQLEDMYKWICYEAQGELTFTQAAADLLDELYFKSPKMDDTRFMYYMERRTDHLMKVAGLLALGNQSMKVHREDLLCANELLLKTERYMPEALGEFGLSPLTVSKQKMIEFLKYARGPVTDRILWNVMNRDMRLIDYRNCLAELILSKKIAKLDTADGMAFIDMEEEIDRELEKEMTENDEEEFISVAAS